MINGDADLSRTPSAKHTYTPEPEILISLHPMKSILLALLVVPALAFAQAEGKPGKPGRGPGAGKGPGKGQRPNPEAQFKKLDTNADASVSLDEFKASPQSQKDTTKAEAMFKRLDKDGDGKLTLEEFKTRGPKKPAGPKPEGEAPKSEAPKADAPAAEAK